MANESTDYDNINDNPEYAVDVPDVEDDELDDLDELNKEDDEEDEEEDDEKDGDEEDEEDDEEDDSVKKGEEGKEEDKDAPEDNPEGSDAKADGVDEDAFASEIKMDSDGKIAGQFVYYGNPEEVDLQGEFFTKETDFWLSDAKSDGDNYECSLPMIYHHGLANLRGAEARVGSWTAIKTMDNGMWIEGQLDISHKYADKIKKLVDMGVLGLSSDSIGRLVSRKKHQKKGGSVWELTSWPLAGVSLTPNPAEPRLLPVVEADAKAIIGDSFDDLIGKAAKRAEKDKAREAAKLRIEIERLRG